MLTKKNDFVELEFTGYADGEIFDTTNIEEAKKAGLVKKGEDERFKTLKICIGQGMMLKTIDNALENKEIGKEFTIHIEAKNAYGKRHPELIRIVPLSAFQETPKRGIFVNVNGIVAKVISINGGRVLIDMNHPLAGKNLLYKIKILRVIEDKKEKIYALLEFYNIKNEFVSIENEKIIVKQKLPEPLKNQLIKKIKELFSMNLEFVEETKK